MKKTGESWATALRHVRARAAKKTRGKPAEAAVAAQPAPLPPMFAYRHRVTRPRDPAVDAYVAARDGVVGETVATLVALVRAQVPAHGEVVHHGAPRFCVDGLPFAYVAGHARHANLGFFEGTRLSDPARVLQGTGKHLRHVKLARPDAVPSATLAQLVGEAAALAGAPRSPAARAPARPRARHPMPEWIEAALAGARLLRAYRARPPYQQNDYVGWIGDAKREATRRQRLAQMLAELERGDAYMKMPWRAPR
jgi:hypothetical protein